MKLPSSHFVHGIEANLTYWQEQVSQFTDAHIHKFVQEQANIILAVELGLALPTSQVAAAELLLLSYPFIERCGYWDKWSLLLETTTTSETKTYPILQARLLNRFGQLLRLRRQIERAIKVHKEAGGIAHSLGEQRVVAEIWFNLSANYRQKRDYEQARNYGQRALAIFVDVPECEKWQAAMLNTLGLIELNCGNLDGAETKLRQSLALWNQFNEPTEQTRVLNSLALTLHRKKQFEAALYYYQQATNQLASTVSELDKVEVHLNLGTLYFEWQQFDKAEMIFRQANTIALRYSGNFYFRAMIANNLGNVLLKQQQFVEAEVHLHRGQMLWQQIGDNLMRANTLGALGEVQAKQGNLAAALSFYDEALSLLKEFVQDAWARKLQRDFTEEKEIVRQALKKEGVCQK